ncbi:MAG: type IV toxin-antitoxin system AbiEi family antitoxin domain-containing protein [Bacilli bacterium]|nr:type IV toxin-antitoxin system AbiEi family antitoxin domain-containing protein [Bacilli bacterium]
MKLEDIIKLADENNGYIYGELIIEHHIPRMYLSRLLKKGMLHRVASGIYITEQAVEDALYIQHLRFGNLVYSGDTALFLNGLSNRQYPDYEASFPYGTSAPKIDGFRVRQSRKATFGLGIHEVETPFGNIVKAYDKERCICDLFLRPNEYDAEERAYAIDEYRVRFLDLEKLYACAKQLGVYEKVKNVFEVLTWN